MSSAAKPEYKDIVDEIGANFSVIYSTIEDLRNNMGRSDFLTSYVFISENIKKAVFFVKDQLQNIIDKSKSFEEVTVSSPLQMATYIADPALIFDYRDSVRDFSDSIRVIVNGLYTNVNRTLAAYIFVYETLEKFGLRPPFILVESNEFSNDTFARFIFSEYDALGSRISLPPNKNQVITYSGIDITDPLALLIIGHEAFHIVDRLAGVYDKFCKASGFSGGGRYQEVIVDIMSSLYFGPAYTYAMQKHFARRYPLSGQSHVEMNIRLLTLSYLQSTLGFTEKKTNEKTFNDFIRMLERRMEKGTREKATEERRWLEKMLDKGVIGYVKHYFNEKNITTYDDFVKVVEKREYEADLDKIDRDKIRFMLRKGIPVAVRPITLLNALTDTGDIDRVDSRVIIASLKKWYVRRYYQKGVEREKTPIVDQ